MIAFKIVIKDGIFFLELSRKW